MHALTRVLDAFPPPSYLALSGAGIDIGTGSVKSVLFSMSGSECALESYRETELAEGVVVGGEIEQPDRMVEVLRSFRLREHVRFAHASLSERKAYLYQTLVPDVEQNLRTAVEFSLESHVPIPPEEALFDYEVVRRVASGTIVSVTAYARRVIELYQDVFRRAGITLRTLEIESQALGRAVVSKKDREQTIMVIDFGRKTTRVAILDHGVVGFTTTVDVGGETLTAAAMKHFGVSAEEAEKIKNERGFLEGAGNRELYETLMTTISVLRDEVARHITYWNSSGEDEVPRKPVATIILVGGNANLKGLPEYLARAFDIPVRVGSVWENAFHLDEAVPPMPYQESLEYATVVGLALRSCKNEPW
ncbi:MAG: type IV pilus assembly protein PilM [Candidatus Paceibacteria bacterium]